MNYKKLLLGLAISLFVVLGGWLWFSKNKVQEVVTNNTAEPEQKSSKIYIDNEFREKNIVQNTYLGSVAPILIYNDKNQTKFIGLGIEGKEKVLDIPMVDLSSVSSIVFDKYSDLAYYKESKYDMVLKKQMGTINKIDIARKTSSTFINSVSGEIEYADQNGLLVLADDAVFVAYDATTGAPLRHESPVLLADSGEYKTEYRMIHDNTVYQIVFDNKGGVVTNGRYTGFQSGSETMKVHFNKIGTLNREYITKNNITPYVYLRSVYDDQTNTKLFYTQTTGDIWPTGSTQPKLVLYPSHPVAVGDYFFTYHTMGNLYDLGNNKYAQVIGDGLVTFDSADMSVTFTQDREQIKSTLLNKLVVALPNDIEMAKAAAGCEKVINPLLPHKGITELGVRATSLMSEALSRRGYPWPVFCLR